MWLSSVVLPAPRKPDNTVTGSRVSAWRTVRTGRRWPLSVAVVGATAVAIGHAVPSAHLLEWVGVAILLAGGLTEHFRLRRQVRLAAVAT
jgi:hypothetical protein